ncbi:MAG TPA: zinc metalloprotease, partial [Planctomycetes bacterium]|nr:zinc metalloprotease [Planctomycetota bacterium]
MKRLLLLACLSPLGAAASAQEPARPGTPVITVGGTDYYSWEDYLGSNAFRAMSLRCGLPPVDPTLGNKLPPSDCTANHTTISPQYNPSQGQINVQVVVHVIMNTNGQGAISDAKVQSQIDILNEDFRAIAGSNGAPGTDTMIQFSLATVDPNGNPTNGITRSTNNTWFNDSGQYYNTLAWDTTRYLNIYTNQAGGALGYVPALPQNGIVGSKADRVVILWSSFGRNAPIGPPYNQGRTTTHEVGHYFGLYHTFQGGCAPVSNCYNNGDRICDTNAEGQAHFGCPNSNSCSSPDPVTNYMDYTDDLCMNMFTSEQTNRMRCTITN